MRETAPSGAHSTPRLQTTVCQARRTAAAGVLLITPLRFRIYALLALTLAALLGALLSFASVGRKFTATGLVLPAAGLLPLKGPGQPAQIERWLLSAGATVVAGTPLADLRAADGTTQPAGLRAPAAGTLFQFAAVAGPGEALGWFAPAGPLAVQVAVSAEARARLQPGAMAHVRIDSLGGERLQARLRSIALAPSESSPDARGGLSYAAIVDLPAPADPAQQQRPQLGLPAEVEFTLERRSLYAWLFDPAHTLMSE